MHKVYAGQALVKSLQALSRHQSGFSWILQPRALIWLCSAKTLLCWKSLLLIHVWLFTARAPMCAGMLLVPCVTVALR